MTYVYDWQVVYNDVSLLKTLRSSTDELHETLPQFLAANDPDAVRHFLVVRPCVLIELKWINWQSIQIYGEDNYQNPPDWHLKLHLYAEYKDKKLDARFRVILPLDATLLPSHYSVENVRGLMSTQEANMNLEKRYTVVIGPNDCGKTSLLIALQLWVEAANVSTAAFEWNEEEWPTMYLQRCISKRTSSLVRRGTTSQTASFSVAFAAPHTDPSELVHTTFDFLFTAGLGWVRFKPGRLQEGAHHPPTAAVCATSFSAIYISSDLRFQSDYTTFTACENENRWREQEMEGLPVDLHNMLHLLSRTPLLAVLEQVLRLAFGSFDSFSRIGPADLFKVINKSEAGTRVSELILEGNGFKKLLYIFAKILLCDEDAYKNLPFRSMYHFLLVDNVDALLFPSLANRLPSLIDRLFTLLDQQDPRSSRSYTVLMTTNSPNFLSSLREDSNLLAFLPRERPTEFRLHAIPPNSFRRLISDSSDTFDLVMSSGVKFLLVGEGSCESKLLQRASSTINAMYQACELTIIPTGDQTESLATSIAQSTIGNLEKVVNIVEREYHSDVWIQEDRKNRNPGLLGGKQEIFVWSAVTIENLFLQLLLPADQSDPITWLISELENPSEEYPSKFIERWLDMFFQDWRVATRADATESIEYESNESELDEFDLKDDFLFARAEKPRNPPDDSSLLDTVVDAYNSLIGSKQVSNSDDEGLTATTTRLCQDLKGMKELVELHSEARWKSQHLKDKLCLEDGTMRKILAEQAGQIPKKALERITLEFARFAPVDPPNELWRFMDVKHWFNINLFAAPMPPRSDSMLHADIARLEGLLKRSEK